MAAQGTTEVTRQDRPNIVIVESMTTAEILLMAEEATSRLLDSGASFHVTPYRSHSERVTYSLWISWCHLYGTEDLAT